MTNNFEEYKGEKYGHNSFTGITVQKTHVYVSNSAEDMLGAGARYALLFDREKALIKMMPGDGKDYAVSRFISARISSIMPVGRYEFLEKDGDGYVFNISSLAGRNPFAGGAAYNASKFGVNGFTEAMMLDHRKDNVRVTSIMPGSVDTDFGHVPGRSSTGNDWKIAPQDIAEVIVSLLRMPARTLVSRVEMRPSKPR